MSRVLFSLAQLLSILIPIASAQQATAQSGRLDSIVEGIREDMAAKPGADYQAALAKMKANDEAKEIRRIAAARGKASRREQAEALVSAAIVSNRAVSTHSDCKNNHAEADTDFANPISAPGGDLWQKGVDSFNTLGWTRVNAMQFDLSSIARQSQFPRPTHEMTTTVIVERDLGWTASEIVQTMAKSAGLFARCGIQMKLNVVHANPPNVQTFDANKDPFRDVTEESARELVRRHTPVYSRPIVYFVRSRADAGAGEQSSAFAMISEPRKILGPWKREGYGTAFIGRDVLIDRATGRTIDRQAIGGDRLVVPVTHELAHLLADDGHQPSTYSDGTPNTTPNILQGQSRYISSNITPEQCQQFRENRDYVRPIAR